MSNWKKPTKAQKILMSEKRLNYNNWLVKKDTNDFMEIIHRDSNNIKRIEK